MKCSKHYRYSGKQHPRTNCEQCWRVFIYKQDNIVPVIVKRDPIKELKEFFQELPKLPSDERPDPLWPQQKPPPYKIICTDCDLDVSKEVGGTAAGGKVWKCPFNDCERRKITL